MDSADAKSQNEAPKAARPQGGRAAGGLASKAGAPPDSRAVKKAAGKEKSSGPLEVIIKRNEFYRDGYRTLLRIAVMQGVIIFGLIALNIFITTSREPMDKYFATTEDGRLIPMLPLDQPNLSEPALMSWAAQAATESMTFSFNDFRRRLQDASRHFTKTGWESFTAALQKSRIMETVEASQQVVSAAPQGAPVILQEGVMGGRYVWRLQMPMLITYQSGTRARTDSWLVNMVVVRVPRLESPNGVGIEQWVALPRQSR